MEDGNMSYKTWKQTREQENPVSKFWGKKYRSKSIWAYLKSRIRAFFSKPVDLDIDDLHFDKL